MQKQRLYPLKIQPWSAVRIVPQAQCCARAAALRDKRYLAREVPALPLKGCTLASTCRCLYKHYVDRRAGPRRAKAASAPLERRSARDRRGSS